MGLYLRGNIWWFEVYVKSTKIRKSTGFRKNEKSKAKAVLDATRLAIRNNLARSNTESILNAIYDRGRLSASREALRLDSMWLIYEDWLHGKGRTMTDNSLRHRKNMLAYFCEWASSRHLVFADDVSVPVAREYANYIANQGLANKSVRNRLQELGTVWRAVAQCVSLPLNPWSAVTPDDDGSSVRRLAFTEEEEARILAECLRVGHGWYLASLISRWTALRYGDVARLTWEQVDMERRVIDIVPSKTAKHKVRLLLPIADALYSVLADVPPAERAGFVLPEHATNYGLPFAPSFASVLVACKIDTRSHTFHSWRHTCASRLSEAGASTEVIRRFGGWTNDAMAHHYDHALRLDEMRVALEKSTSS